MQHQLYFLVFLVLLSLTASFQNAFSYQNFQRVITIQVHQRHTEGQTDGRHAIARPRFAL